MKGMIFDADGTLLDSMGLWEQIDRDFLKAHGLTYSRQISEQVKTMSLTQSSEYFRDLLYPRETVTAKDIAKEIDAMCGQAYALHISAKPFALDFLQAAKAEGYQMCVATASKEEPIRMALERLGLLPYFTFVLGADQVDSGKTDPAIFLECARRFGSGPEEIWVFEDALHAAKTASLAGFRVIGLYDESIGRNKKEMKGYCRRYVDSFAQLLDQEKCVKLD